MSSARMISAGTEAVLLVEELARVQASDRVLVLGESSDVALLATRVARARGAEVLTETPPEGRIDVILTSSGGLRLRRAIQRLAPFGRLVLHGAAARLSPDLPLDTLTARSATTQALRLETFTRYAPETVNRAGRRFQRLVEGEEVRLPAELPRPAPLPDRNPRRSLAPVELPRNPSTALANTRQMLGLLERLI